MGLLFMMQLWSSRTQPLLVRVGTLSLVPVWSAPTFVFVCVAAASVRAVYCSVCLRLSAWPPGLTVSYKIKTLGGLGREGGAESGQKLLEVEGVL